MADLRCVAADVFISDADGGAPRRVRLGWHTTVGRDADNDICLLDPMLSRHHAEFCLRNGVAYVIDLESTNGTYVNDVRVRGEMALADGDVVAAGGTSLVFRETETSTAAEEGYADGIVCTEISAEPTARATTKVLDVLDLSHEDRGLGLVCQVTNALVARHPLPEVFDKVLQAILDSIPAQRAAIVLLEQNPPVPVVKATRTRPGTGEKPIRLDIVARALRDRKSLLARDFGEGADASSRGGASVPAISSVMCAPLWSGANRRGDGRLSGLIYLDCCDSYSPLTERDLHILTMLANITATKIENIRLLEDSAQRRRIEEDMLRAAEILSDLLPQDPPSIQGYRVCGTTEPCRTVGGDYFDFEDDGRSLHMALADVSGRGTSAAMLTVALRATVRAHWRCGTLTEATARINQTFHQTVPPDKYATFFVARLDPLSGRLEYVNAGHNRPLLILADGRWRRLEAGGTVIGAFADTTYREDTVVLEPGACLLVFSDGVSDAWPDQDEADRNLVSLVRARRKGEPAGLRTQILDAVRQTNDDRTLIILERLTGDTHAPC